MKQPRFYQTEAKEAVIHRIRENSKKGVASRILVDAAAGAGKTIMMAIIARHVHERGGRVLQIARQPILAEQTYREFYDFGVPSGMYAAKFNKRQVYQVTVGTEGTIVNGLADFNKPVDLLLIDECLTGDSMIETSDGPVRIDDERLSDLCIKCIDESTGEIFWHKPVRVFTNGIRHVSSIKLSSGEEIKCTSTHKLLSNGSWVSAGNLSAGMTLTLDGSQDSFMKKLLRACAAVVKKCSQKAQ